MYTIIPFLLIRMDLISSQLKSAQLSLKSVLPPSISELSDEAISERKYYPLITTQGVMIANRSITNLG